MFGSVRNWRHVPCPPMLHESPLFSISTSRMFVAMAPFPAVSESPMAPMMSISPGLRENQPGRYEVNNSKQNVKVTGNTVSINGSAVIQ
uniref:Uncharacterized protein n=1 Tax=Anopheles atroparvus TaxID=41427 RepID=A0A182J0W0_ANOAO